MKPCNKIDCWSWEKELKLGTDEFFEVLKINQVAQELWSINSDIKENYHNWVDFIKVFGPS